MTDRQNVKSPDGNAAPLATETPTVRDAWPRRSSRENGDTADDVSSGPRAARTRSHPDACTSSTTKARGNRAASSSPHPHPHLAHALLTHGPPTPRPRPRPQRGCYGYRTHRKQDLDEDPAKPVTADTARSPGARNFSGVSRKEMASTIPSQQKPAATATAHAGVISPPPPVPGRSCHSYWWWPGGPGTDPVRRTVQAR